MLANSRRFSKGASMVEYAILVAIIAVAAVAGVTTFGGKIQSALGSVGDKVSTQANQ